MSTTQPTRSLLGQGKTHRYVNAVSTDIRRTFRRFRLLSYLRRHQREQQPAGGTPGLRLQAA